MACKELLLSPLQPWRSARVSLFSCLPSSHLDADTSTHLVLQGEHSGLWAPARHGGRPGMLSPSCLASLHTSAPLPPACVSLHLCPCFAALNTWNTQ